MENIIKYVVECDSMYGLIALTIFFSGLSIIGGIIYKILQLILPYIYKMICKHCNTTKKYKDVHSKFDVKDVSIETDLHR